MDLVDEKGEMYENYISNNNMEDIFNDLEIEKVNLLIGVPYVELKTTTIK